jgi:hypothetical protein
MQSKLRTRVIELEIEDENGESKTEEYRIKELPTHLKLRMSNWEEVPEYAFYEIFATCVIDSAGEPTYNLEDVQYLEPDVVSTIINEIQDLSKDRKIKVNKKKN